MIYDIFSFVQLLGLQGEEPAELSLCQSTVINLISKILKKTKRSIDIYLDLVICGYSIRYSNLGMLSTVFLIDKLLPSSLSKHEMYYTCTTDHIQIH